MSQRWELVPKCHGTLLCPQSVVRVVFHDRRLQYTEQQQLDGWRWSWPGDRILDISDWGGTRALQGCCLA